MFDVHSEFLFPRQLVISKDLEYHSYKDELISYCLNKKVENHKGNKYTNVHSWQSDDILKDSVSGKIPRLFEQRIRQNVFNCLKNELKISNPQKHKIHRMWIQISQKGSYNVSHNHPFSHYSGVFYVKTTNNANCGCINFYSCSNSNDYQELLFRNSEILKSNNMQVKLSYIPYEGTIFLFPSGLIHSVSENETNSDRISIAFDILFDNY
jgi:uncharacterized protein (TIGR02466 family)